MTSWSYQDALTSGVQECDHRNGIKSVILIQLQRLLLGGKTLCQPHRCKCRQQHVLQVMQVKMFPPILSLYRQKLGLSYVITANHTAPASNGRPLCTGTPDLSTSVLAKELLMTSSC